MDYGLLDTKDKVWMGNKDGPLLYKDEAFAKVCAQICDRSLKQVLGRTRAIPYEPPQELKLRDEKPILIDPVTALSQLEDGL